MATKMAGQLTVQEQAQIVARYEVWNSVVAVQRWWRVVKGRNATIRQEIIKNCHSILLTVWCIMTATRVIGPYLLRDTMNAEIYLQMLEDYLWPMESGRENIDELVFMHDDVPPHFAPSVRASLDQKFPGRLAGTTRTSRMACKKSRSHAM